MGACQRAESVRQQMINVDVGQVTQVSYSIQFVSTPVCPPANYLCTIIFVFSLSLSVCIAGFPYLFPSVGWSVCLYVCLSVSLSINITSSLSYSAWVFLSY